MAYALQNVLISTWCNYRDIKYRCSIPLNNVCNFPLAAYATRLTRRALIFSLAGSILKLHDRSFARRNDPRVFGFFSSENKNFPCKGVNIWLTTGSNLLRSRINVVFKTSSGSVRPRRYTNTSSTARPETATRLECYRIEVRKIVDGYRWNSFILALHRLTLRI